MDFRKKKYPQFLAKPTDLERDLAIHISKTGKEQIKKRRKAKLSVYYSKNGRIVEVRPDQTIIEGKEIGSRWITLEKQKRTLRLK